MNNGNDTEKDSVNILSNNRGNGNTIVVLAPIFIMVGGFLIFLMSIGMLVFFLVDRAKFLAFMPDVFTGSIELGKWMAIVALVGLAIKFVFGAAIKEVGAPLVHLFVAAFNQFRRDRVVHANDNMIVYTGKLSVHDHMDVRQNYNIRQVDSPTSPLQIEAPKSKIYPARDLYASGQMLKSIQEGKVIMGYGERGQLVRLNRKKQFSTIDAGIPASGKTTTAFWQIVQQLVIGGRLILIDPHMYYTSEDGERSLTQELAPFSKFFVFPPIDGTSVQAVRQRVKYVRSLVDERKQSGYIARLSDTVLLVIEECNSIFDMEEIRDELVTDLAYIQREGRKWYVNVMLIGHRFSADDIGKAKIRTIASTVMVHRYNDQAQAEILLGRSNGKRALSLFPGLYLFSSINQLESEDGEPEIGIAQIQTPMISALDAPWVLRLKEEVEEWLAVSDVHSIPASDQLPTSFRNQPHFEHDIYMKEPGNVVEGALTENLSPELSSLMHKVMEVEADGVRNQEELIERVWGPEYTSGRKRQEIAIPQLMEIRKAMALQLAQFRSNV